MNVAIEPSREDRSQQENDRDGIKIDAFQAPVDARTHTQRNPSEDEQHADPKPGSHRNLHQPADEVQTKKKDQRARNRSQQSAVAHQKRPNGARRSAKRNENN